MEFREAVPYVVSAYMGIWLVLFIYFVVIQRKLDGIKKQVEVLGKAVDKKVSEKEPETVTV